MKSCFMCDMCSKSGAKSLGVKSNVKCGRLFCCPISTEAIGEYTLIPVRKDNT